MASTQMKTVKSEEQKRKAIFRQVLESPFNPTWQSVDAQTNREILDILYSLLSPLSSYRPALSQVNPTKKRRKQKSKSSTCQHPLFINPPPFISYLTIGFNATTMQLESEIHKLSSQRLRAVFVARGDTSITHLYAHFPAMASLLPQLHLVSLLNGAEARFCEALGLQRVQVIGLMDGTPGAEILFQLVEEKVPKIRFPWSVDGKSAFVGTKVKWVEAQANLKRKKVDATKSKMDLDKEKS